MVGGLVRLGNDAPAVELIADLDQGRARLDACAFLLPRILVFVGGHWSSVEIERKCQPEASCHHGRRSKESIVSPSASSKSGRMRAFASCQRFMWECRLVAMARPERRLSAILHADLAGFVGLVESEEDLTFENLRTARTEIWQPAIKGAGGSLVHSAG